MIDLDTKKTIFKDINNLIKKIKKCSSKTMYNIYLFELEQLYFLCEELKIFDYPNIDNYSSKSIEINDIKLFKTFYNQLLKDKNYHLEFIKNKKFIDYSKYEDNNNFTFDEKISSQRNIELICEFLKNYDLKIYDLFEKLIIENRILVIEEEQSDTPAYIIPSYGSHLPYIVIKSEMNLLDSINLIHEIGHAYDYQLNRSNKIFNQKKINCLEETISYYFQFIYIDFLKKQKNFYKNIDKLKYIYNYPFITYINDLEKEYNDLDFNQLKNNNIDEYLNYTYGIAIAYHFLDRYIENPSKTKKEINEFIYLNGQYNMIEMLEKFDLKEELIESKVLKKYL